MLAYLTLMTAFSYFLAHTIGSHTAIHTIAKWSSYLAISKDIGKRPVEEWVWIDHGGALRAASSPSPNLAKGRCMQQNDCGGNDYWMNKIPLSWEFPVPLALRV